MIFSNKIYKIINGSNGTLYSHSKDELTLYIHNNSLRKYKILNNLNKNCVFIKEYNYKKIIQINDDLLGLASNGYITTNKEENI